MIRRFARDETGITMAVTVFMVLLIGVMGAGLLTFVMSDLKSVIEVNKGQKATDIAEAGVQAAKAHLRQDSFREHYDTDANGANDCVSPSGIRVGKENWGRATYHWEPDPNAATSNPGECYTLTNNTANDPNTPWPENKGVTRTFDGGRYHVTIECMTQTTDPTSDLSCKQGPGADPVPSAPVNVDPSNTKFFKITSTGYDTAAGDGAVRKIAAVYSTSKRTYAPIAFWTPRDMDFSGVDCVRKLSAFAGGNILGATKGSNGCGPVNPINSAKTVADRSTDTTRCPTGSPLPCPPDAIYGDWKQGPNPTGRTDASGNPITKVGFGALGKVCFNQCVNPGDSVADGYNDYDSTTGTDSTRTSVTGFRKRYKFVTKVTDPTSQITFPFDTVGVYAPPASPTNPDPSKMIDPGLLEEMRSAADQQKNCYSVGTTCTRNTSSTLTVGTTGGGTRVAWPGPGAILFVDGADVDIKQDSEGMIVVRDGNVTISGNITFKGIIIVKGNGNLSGGSTGSCDPNSGKGYYTSTGNPTLDGYVAASGCIKVSGNITPNTTLNYTDLNTFYDTKLWSWRECYNNSFAAGVC